MTRYRFIWIAFFGLCSLAGAQDITVNVEYPRVVSVGEQVRLVYTVNTSGGEFVSPDFDGFYKLSGPNTSYSQSTIIRNGRRTSETAYSFVFYLQATREGKYTIPPASYTKNRNTYNSAPAVIEVVGDASSGKAPGGEAVEGGGQESTDSDIYIRVILSKHEVFVGEPIVASVKLYTRIDIAGISEIKYPSFSGFMREEIETPALTNLERENVNGTIYGTGIFQKFLLYPQRTGEIEIDPAQITVLISQRGGATDPFFGDFFQSFNNVPRIVTGTGGKVTVKPLPANRPTNFTGAVGAFDIKAAISNDTVNVNEALSFTVTLNGRGNLKLADAPAIMFPTGFESYDPKTTSNITNSESGSAGTKTFEYLIIPRSAGDFTIPAINYTFFNTAGNNYTSVNTEPFVVHVRKGSGLTSDPQLFIPSIGEDVRYLGQDIRFIKSSDLELHRSRDYLLTRRAFYTVYGFSLLAFVLIIVLRKEQVRRNSDRVRMRNRRAGKIAGKRFKIARKYMMSGETDKFYEALLSALWGYTSDKLNIPQSELTRQRAEEILKSKGVNEDNIQTLMDMTMVCEQVRYAPAPESAEPVSLYEKAVVLIKRIEGDLH